MTQARPRKISDLRPHAGDETERGRIARVSNRGESVSVRWSDGCASQFQVQWLRDNCGCSLCRDEVSGQRLFDITTLPDELVVTDASVTRSGNLSLCFSPEGHAGVIDAHWLRSNSYDDAGRRERYLIACFWGRELTQELPSADYVEVTASRWALGNWLHMVRTYGFAMLRGVPTETGQVARVAELFGHVRETNYGRVFDVILKPRPNNLAYTAAALGVHTDNPYRDPVPGLQLLHCLAARGSGGASLVVDGFLAAERLRAEAPGHFDLLSRYEVPFRFTDRNTDLRASGRLIAVDRKGAVTAIRYNNRSAAAFELPTAVMTDFYAAYRHFGQLLRDRDAEVSFSLTPGDLFIVDNRRVLHGRREYSAHEHRHLQGCYADRDALDSLLRRISDGIPQ